MVVSGGYMRKPSARVGTAAYWIEVFAEQARREAERRRTASEPPVEPRPGASPAGSVPQPS